MRACDNSVLAQHIQGLQPPAPRLGPPQSSLEQFLQMNPHEKPAQRVQIRLEFQAVHQNRERRFDRRVAKILQPSPTPPLAWSSGRALPL